ncbi:MAG: aminotransferase class I/II-fold pyridoxal phosphate-dependent enzyme [Hoeflea sp.]|uniref:DegT/DnrJ/EryC1/StrS family aminotransferase n=1 Tax=Hoeflea sp. TaxID=1940281 RepID=UPI00272FFD41|nr:aminotransferase class I/II-fold pyridoxal phosphate-dependent enzyme [Hoeflea sp.]MDP2120300.1 aminotransferase class I/II-fold pyridoxal phosphate-dependent enzyme [Hoeflea sp.]MDZ7603697.1 aminotransferase class I/II-fold pyridoxal phosphate-dependent enzyme [Hoeflea sp.]
MKPFTGSFTQQEALDDEVVAAAAQVLRSGRLHRYNTAAGELSKASELEQAYAAYQGARYCLACASGGYAMAIALRAAGLKAGESVLTNGFTLAPVPGAIASAGGRPVLVEITEDLVIDLDDLDRKARSTGARFLLLSNMRGHLADMDRLADLVRRHSMILIEDCAHTMGAAWNGRKSGNFGLAGCFSTQTYKHLNSGEGGLLTSDDPDFMARAILLSGSYMLYERHGAAPSPEVFERIRLETPNMSGRMDNLRAAILLPQLARLDDSIARWNERYRAVEDGLEQVEGLVLPRRPEAELYVGSSLQFRLPGLSRSGAEAFVGACKAHGVELKWFGASDPVAFTSNHHSWRYVDPQLLPETDRVLSTLFDMRLPLTFTLEECRHIASVIAHCARGLSPEAA